MQKWGGRGHREIGMQKWGGGDTGKLVCKSGGVAQRMESVLALQ
jgi:hypothetical protein